MAAQIPCQRCGVALAMVTIGVLAQNCLGFQQHRSLTRSCRGRTLSTVEQTTIFFDADHGEGGTVSEDASEAFLSSLSAKVQQKLLANSLDIQVPGPGASREGTYFESTEPSRALSINLDLLNFRAKRERKRGKPHRARQLWHQCLEIDKFDGRAWLALSRDAERELRDPRLAAEYLTSCLSYDPSNVHVRQAYGIFLERQGLRRQALEQFDRALKSDPNHAASLVAKARLLERKCKKGSDRSFSVTTQRESDAYEEARACYAAAIRAEPSNEQALVASAMFEASSRRIESARLLFARAVRANPKNAAAFAAWAKIEEKERPSEARRLYAEAHRAHKSNTRALTSWARFELRQGNSSAAVDLLQTATRVRTGSGGYRGGCVDATVFATLGEITWRHRRDPVGARNAFRRAVAVDAAQHRAYRSWAAMEIKLGNLQLARDIVQQGIWGCTTGVTDSRKLAELWRTAAKVEVVQLSRGENATALAAARNAFRKTISLLTSQGVSSTDLTADATRIAANVYVEWADFEATLPSLLPGELAPIANRRRNILQDALKNLPGNHLIQQALLIDTKRHSTRKAHNNSGYRREANEREASSSASPQIATSTTDVDRGHSKDPSRTTATGQSTRRSK